MKRVIEILFAGLVLIVAGLGFAPPAEAIVGRHDVDSAEYLLADDAYPAVFDFFEGGGVGTLISPQWAVTAAHVGRDIPQDGSHMVEIGGKSYAVEGVVLHPDWSQAHFNDIALVKFAEPIAGVTPIDLYRDGDEVGQIATLVGRGDFGTGLTGATVMDGRLRRATNRVEKIESGSLWFLFDDPESGNATPLEGVSGPGDSGGPALLEVDGLPRIIGVSSFGIGLGSDPPGPGHYGIWDTYTNISTFQDWIDETIANGAVDSKGEVGPEIVVGDSSAVSPNDNANQIAETPNLNNGDRVSDSGESSMGVNVYIVVGSAVIILALLGVIIVLVVRLRQRSDLV